MKRSTKLIAAVAAVPLALALASCSAPQDKKTEKDAVQEKVNSRTAYIPKNDVEFKNFNRAQELYDNPAAIQWCTAFPSSTSAPIITTPIAGKLTTSSTSYFSPTERQTNSSGAMVNEPARSVDAMFHGDSYYRYGFTPAGAYQDFSNSLELMCSTTLTEYQRQNTFVEGVAKGATKEDVAAAQKAAEAALKAGDGAKATALLEGK